MKNAQINRSLKFGYCDEVYKFSKKIPENTKVWINDRIDADLLRFYKSERMPEPEFKRKLQDWIPKKGMLIRYDNLIYQFGYNNIKKFKKQLRQNNVKMAIFQYSLIPASSFVKQDDIEIIKKLEFLDLQDVLNLKNKIVYIFDVNLK